MTKTKPKMGKPLWEAAPLFGSKPAAPKVTYLVTVVIRPGKVESHRPRTPKQLAATVAQAFPNMSYAIVAIEHDGKIVKSKTFPGKGVYYL